MTNEKQIVAGPLAVYIKAYSGSGVPSMPAINRAAADLTGTDSYTLLGTRGADSVKREGVSIVSTQEYVDFMGADSIKATDRWRTKDELALKFALVDMRLETIAHLLDQSVTEDTSGTPDHKTIGLGRPKAIKLWTVLARGRSPYANEADKLRQYLLYAGSVTSNYEEVNALEAATSVDFEFKALALTDSTLDEEDRFGMLRAWSGA